MVDDKEIDDTLESMYAMYGSYTKYLFGIEPRHKKAIRSIIKLTLERKEKQDGKKKNSNS